MKRFTYILFLLYLMFSYSAFAEKENDNAGSKGTIAGRVVDGDQLPLPGAAVVIKKLNKGVITDVNGFYRIHSLSPGEYDLAVSYIGFKENTQKVSVASGKTSELNFEMEVVIDVSNVWLGKDYPKGIFVVQDGYNYNGETLLSQNYKYLSWEKIETLFTK